MSIEATITVTLAEVSVSDEYQIELRTRRRLTALEPDEAVQLANELMAAAGEAVRTLRADLGGEPRSEPFDVAPICRECREGKHGACNGQAIIEVRDEVEVHACGCEIADHKIIGGSG